MIFLGCLTGALAFAFLIKAAIPVAILFALLGIGLGISTSAAAALISDITCGSRKGETFGIFNTARMMGVVVGPLIAGLAADSYGISSTVAAFAIIAMLVTASAMAAIEPNATCVGKSS